MVCCLIWSAFHLCNNDSPHAQYNEDQDLNDPSRPSHKPPKAWTEQQQPQQQQPQSQQQWSQQPQQQQQQQQRPSSPSTARQPESPSDIGGSHVERRTTRAQDGKESPINDHGIDVRRNEPGRYLTRLETQNLNGGVELVSLPPMPVMEAMEMGTPSSMVTSSGGGGNWTSSPKKAADGQRAQGSPILREEVGPKHAGPTHASPTSATTATTTTSQSLISPTVGSPASTTARTTAPTTPIKMKALPETPVESPILGLRASQAAAALERGGEIGQQTAAPPAIVVPVPVSHSILASRATAMPTTTTTTTTTATTIAQDPAASARDSMEILPVP